jgi:hypothetical protein
MLIGVICVCALPENPSLLKVVRKRDTTQRYCGRNLVNILRFLCRGQYNGIEEERKRSVEVSPAQRVGGTVYTAIRNKRESVSSL